MTVPGQGAARSGAPGARGAAGRAPAETTLLVIDDHRAFAELLSATLDAAEGVRCLGTAATAEEGLRLVADLRPSVVVMDIEMPGMDGLTATRQLRATRPATAVAVISAHSDGIWIARAARAGASAFLPKGGPLQEMIDLLRAARPGPMILPPSLLQSEQVRVDALRRTLGLTSRELEVVGLMAQGLVDKHIATVLGISLHTCRGYIKTVYAALGVSSRIHAVNEARRLHLVD